MTTANSLPWLIFSLGGQRKICVQGGLQVFARLDRNATNFFRRPAYRHRRHCRFGVTLVVWNENAREKCFYGGAAIG